MNSQVNTAIHSVKPKVYYQDSITLLLCCKWKYLGLTDDLWFSLRVILKSQSPCIRSTIQICILWVIFPGIPLVWSTGHGGCPKMLQVWPQGQLQFKQLICIKTLLFTLSHDVISWEMFICAPKSVRWFPPKSIQLSWRDVWKKQRNCLCI